MHARRFWIVWFWMLVALMVPAQGPGADKPKAAGSGPATERPRLVAQLGHQFGVTSVAFSPDGKRVLTGSYDDTARLWDTESGKELRSFQGHAAAVFSVAFSADGKRVLTGSGDKTARLWDAETGNELHSFQGHTDRVSSVAFSPDGKQVLTGSWDWTARLWDAETGKELRSFQSYFVDSVAFSPDGKRVLTSSHDRMARLWDVETGKELRSFQGHSDIVDSVAFSPDGKRVLTGSHDRTARLWDADTGKEFRSFQGHSIGVSSVAFSPDGKRVLTGSGDKTARLWDTESGKELRSIQGHSDFVSSIAFSPDGKQLLTGSGDKTTRLWDVETGKELRSFQGHADWVESVAFSPDGKRVLTGSHDKRARLWDAESGKELRSFQGHSALVSSVAFSPDGKRVLTGSWDKTACLWDAESGKELRSFQGHWNWVSSVAFSPDGKRVLTGSWDHMARLWDAESGKELWAFQGHSSEVFSVAFSPDGKRVLTGSSDSTARLWDVETGKELRSFQGHSYWVSSVAFSPDGKRVLTGSWDHTARLWDADTGKEIRAFQGYSYTVSSLAFSPDGKRVLTAVNDTARLWDAGTGKQLCSFQGHSHAVSSVAFSPDGKRVLTGSSDSTARLWDADTGKEIACLINSRDGYLVATPDNYYMASRGGLEAVAFGVGNRAFPFEQFDLKFNRPDLVLGRIGLAPKELIDAYQQAYRKRLRRMNFTEEMLGDDFHVPEVAVTSENPLLTREKSLKLKVRAGDSKYLLDRLNVHVNGVPIHGTAGTSLRDKKVKTWEQDVDIELSYGRNLIQVSVLNEKGAESLKETIEITCDAPASKPDLYVVGVGVSTYHDTRYNLTYADKDARDLAAFFQGKTASFGTIHVLAIVNQEATRDQILKVKEMLRHSRVDDEVIVFFAGHGLLDRNLDYYFATTDVDFKDPSAKGLSYDAIEVLMDGIPARKKLLLMDTCHSGELDKETVALRAPEKVADGQVKARGFRGLEVLDEPKLGLANSRQLLQDLFADLREGTGAVVIASAGGMEFAFESADWKNGVFTYALLDGLHNNKADKNKDGRVQVSELREYVLEEVRRLTGGRQSPTSRKDNLEFDFPVD